MAVQQTTSAGQDTGDTFATGIVLEHPIELVWDAISRKAWIDRYYFLPINADVTTVGGALFYGSPDAKLITGVVLAFEPQQLLKHSFRFTGEVDKTETIVTYSLAAAGQGTHLRVEQQGYAAGSQGYADVAGGWPVILDQLKAVLAARK